MKALSPITKEFFIISMGRVPENDDLDRCNCDKAGGEGHEFCGWNYRKNCPSFINHYDDVVYLLAGAPNSRTGVIFTDKNEALQVHNSTIKKGLFSKLVEY